MRIATISAGFLALSLGFACGSDKSVGSADNFGGFTGKDGSAGGAGDSGSCATSCGGACCEAGDRCFQNQCIPDNGTCAAGEACLNDSDCVEGVCVPWGTAPLGTSDPTCTRTPEPLTEFAPAIQCEWPGTHAITDP